MLVMIAAAVLLTRRKRKAPADSGSIQKEQAGIYMRLELVRGELAGGQSQQELELRDDLILWCRMAAQPPGRPGFFPWKVRYMWKPWIPPARHRSTGRSFRGPGDCAAGMKLRQEIP